MEDVRMLVQEEGRAARNLIAFHVDLTSPTAGKSVSRKPPSSPRLLNEARMTKRTPLVAKTGSPRVRSASTGRDKKSELQARYWAFLFENLQRAVSEIYQTCESDESVSECKEVILVLENYTKEFHNLIDWFKLKWEYENTPPPQRPTSLAWEVRKSSPCKVLTSLRPKKVIQDDNQSPVKKQLNFLSDAKQSSSGECLKKAFILGNELSNKYGLTFGDLEEHLQYDETVSEITNVNNHSSAEVPETVLNIRVEENNKENCSSLVDNSCKPLAATEVFSSNQSSQTEEVDLQSPITFLKIISSTVKKPQPTTKSSAGPLGKTSTLSPLTINKTTVTGPSRKAVPVSPTSTIPPRMVPGRNVSAAAFVPVKKGVSTTQAKVNTNLNRSTNNLSKPSCIPQTFGEKVLTEGLNREASDTNKLVEQEKSLKVPAIDLTQNEIEVPVLTLNAEKTITNGTMSLHEANATNVCLDQSQQNNQPTTKSFSSKEKASDAQSNKNYGQLKTTDETGEVICLVDNESHRTQKLDGNSVGPVTDLDSTIAVELNKCDIGIQTDLSHLADLAAAKQDINTLQRQKTAPCLTRKSDEMLASADHATLKVVKSSVVNQVRPPATALKKQTNNPEGNNDKTAHDKHTIEKLTSEKAPGIKMTNPSLRKQKSVTETSHEKVVSEKDFIENYTLGFPPLRKPIKEPNNALGFPPYLETAKQDKINTLQRQKTAPCLTRKSDEMLSSADHATLKVVKSSVVNQDRTPATTQKKQTINTEGNSDQIAHEKHTIEKSTSEKAPGTKMTHPSLRKQKGATGTNHEKVVSEKDFIENYTLGFPPLRNPIREPNNNSEKLTHDKSATEKSTIEKSSHVKSTNEKSSNTKFISEKSSNTKFLNEKSSNDKTISDKAKNTTPVVAAVSKIFRSSTAIELRPRAVQNKTVPAAVKTATNNKQVSEKTSVEKKVSAKPANDKLRNEKLTNVKPAIVTCAPKVFRSSTSIELRPRVSFNRNVTSAVVKSKSLENQVAKVKGAVISRNPSTLNKSKTLFKSEQNLKKKSSIDEDGWETVKGRNRWKLSQSSSNIKAARADSRFHQPSPAVSLPTLAIAGDTATVASDPKPAKLHKDRQNQEIRVALRNKAQPTAEPAKPAESERKKVSNGRVKELKRTVNGVKQESNSSKIDKLMDILSSEDERMNEEENRKSKELYEKEKKLTKQIQDLKNSEIEVDTETDDAETDGETNVGSEEDDTNCRINALKASYENVCSQLSWADQMDTLEKLEKLIASDTSSKGIPWAERLSTLEQLEELVARHPGRALELHQKLSSPSRRRHLPDTIQRHRERQESAQLKREQLLQDKTNKMRELLNKVEEVQKQQAQLKEDRKKRIAEKLKRAEENRALFIRSIQRKAHDEDEKLREIMFINELEAQNKRHDFIASCQEKEGRLRGIHDERQRKQEEKAAKEAAVEERRRILEAERQERLEKMQEKRRKREERIGREQQEKEKERQELAREKVRDHKERVQALQAIQQANTEELQKKIQQKQEDSARRHEENIEHIRQRALESGALRGAGDDGEAPRLTPYDTYRLCVKCNVLIESEVYLLSHLRGKAHQEAVRDVKDDSEPVIVDAPPDKMDAKLAQDRERQRALRKRCKKIRSRMAQRGEEFLSKLQSEGVKKTDSPNKMRLLKCIRSVDKLHSSQGVGQWPDNAVTLLERNLAEINRLLDKQNELDQKVFQDLNGFNTLSNILNLALDIPKNMSPYLPPKCFLTTCMVYSLACLNHPDNSRFVVFSNKIALVLDLLLNRLNTLITDDYRTSNKSLTNLPVDPVAGALMKLFALILSHSQENVPADLPDMAPRLQDIISYTVSVGVVDKLALYCSSVRDPIDNNPQAAQFLLNAIQLLTTLAQTKCVPVKGDPTQLLATLRVTELVGAVSMLYGMLLHQGAPPSSPPALPPHTVCVTQATLQLLKAVAQMDLNMFQSVLGAEGISLQLRHIASYLLWYCAHPGSDAWLEDNRQLLHQVIEVVGYFAVNHYDNQMMLQSGHMPTVLQQLCNLPFSYFSDPLLSCHLLPSLLACCHGNPENKTILEQELNYQLLEDFRNSEVAKSNPLVQLIK